MNKTELKAKAARYVKIVEWSDEDQCFVGTCPGLMFGGAHGQDEAKVYADLCQAVEEVIALKEAEDHLLPKPTATRRFSGRVTLTLEPKVHQRLALQAEANGESLNQLVTRKLVAA